MYKIIIAIVFIVSLILYLKFNKKKYIMVICAPGGDMYNYKSLMEYSISLSKLVKRELLIQDAGDIIGGSKWENYFNMNNIESRELVKYNYMDKRVVGKKNVLYLDITDATFWTKLKNAKNQNIAIIAHDLDAALSILKNIVDKPHKIEYNLLIYNLAQRIKTMVGKYIIIDIKDEYYIINDKYRVRKIHNILKKHTIQTILCRKKNERYDSMSDKYNIIEFSQIFGELNVYDDYIREILINELYNI